jgi:hypothetical protein
MPRISTYPVDTVVTDNDKFIGTDGDNENTTKNFRVSNLGTYFLESGILGGVSKQVAFPSASAVWNVQHNYNRYPSITTVDSSGNVVVGDIIYDDSNTITVTFSAPFSGVAYLN